MDASHKIAWAAGLFEGEGCLCFSKKGAAFCAVAMTDEDVVRAFSSVIGFGNVNGPYSNARGFKCKKRKKPIWRWSAHGFESLQRLCDMFSPYLGQRRSARLREILSKRKALPAPPPPCGHTTPASQNGYRRHRKNGEEACVECLSAYSEYMRSFKKTGGGRGPASIDNDLRQLIFQRCECGVPRKKIADEFRLHVTTVSKIYSRMRKVSHEDQ